jgi:hypothetical protein
VAGGPKKSRPRSESPGLVCFGGAGGPLGGGECVIEGVVVAGRGVGRVLSPNRSISSD